METYTAKLYEGEREIQCRSGEDVDALFIWMLAQAHEKRGDFNGHIIHNETQEVIKHFKKGHQE